MPLHRLLSNNDQEIHANQATQTVVVRVDNGVAIGSRYFSSPVPYRTKSMDTMLVLAPAIPDSPATAPVSRETSSRPTRAGDRVPELLAHAEEGKVRTTV